MPLCGIHSGTATDPWETSLIWYEVSVIAQAYQANMPTMNAALASETSSSARRGPPRTWCSSSVMRMCSFARKVQARPRNDVAARLKPAKSSYDEAGSPISRPTICIAVSTAIATKKNPARRPDPK